MSAESAQLAATRHVPQLDGVVVTSRGERATVRGEGDRMKVIGRPAERAQLAATRHVPELDAVVVTSRGQRAAVRGEGDRPNETRMPAERSQSRGHSPRPRS